MSGRSHCVNDAPFVLRRTDLGLTDHESAWTFLGGANGKERVLEGAEQVLRNIDLVQVPDRTKLLTSAAERYDTVCSLDGTAEASNQRPARCDGRSAMSHPATSAASVPRTLHPDRSGPLHVDRLMALAFFPGRAPRSAEYRQGCQAALEYRILGRRMHPVYPAGCCEADAWFAGAEEGHAIWRRKCEAADPSIQQSTSAGVRS